MQVFHFRVVFSDCFSDSRQNLPAASGLSFDSVQVVEVDEHRFGLRSYSDLFTRNLITNMLTSIQREELNMETWFREMLEEAAEEIAKWPAWKKEPEMSNAYMTSSDSSLDPDVVESRLPELNSPDNHNSEQLSSSHP